MSMLLSLFHPNKPKDAVRNFYKHFLAREPENETVVANYARQMSKTGKDGWKLLVDEFINSGEYLEEFGEHFVPSP